MITKLPVTSNDFSDGRVIHTWTFYGTISFAIVLCFLVGRLFELWFIEDWIFKLENIWILGARIAEYKSIDTKSIPYYVASLFICIGHITFLLVSIYHRYTPGEEVAQSVMDKSIKSRVFSTALIFSLTTFWIFFGPIIATDGTSFSLSRVVIFPILPITFVLMATTLAFVYIQLFPWLLKSDSKA